MPTIPTEVGPQLRILYHSAAPTANTGYGRCTKQMAGRLQNHGHEVAVQTLSSVRDNPIWWHGEEAAYDLDEPIKLYPNKGNFGLKGVKDHIADFDADILFTHFDTWMDPAREIIPTVDIPYVSYVIVDHDPCPQEVVDQVVDATETVAMSKFGKELLERKGIRPVQIPHAYEENVYHPMGEPGVSRDVEVMVADESGETNRINTGDRFVFGMVAANHGSRKNIPNHLEAFNKFLRRVDSDALMYIHTDPNAEKGYNLPRIAKEIGIPRSNLLWPPEDQRDNVSDEILHNWYSIMDVHMNCSFGESWGLTITESQACGVPNIVTNFSSMPEQLGLDPGDEPEPITPEHLRENTRGGVYIAPHGLVVDPSVPLYKERVNSRQFISHPEDIFKAMEFYYREPEIRKQHAEDAYEHVNQNYELESQVMPQWYDLFDELEERAV